MPKPILLVIDDDEAIRSQLKWALGDEYEVLLATDRPSGIETFRTRRPDLSLLDLRLPPHPEDATEGMAALATMRGLDHLAKVIVISGLSEREAAMRAVGEGAYDYLCKPVQIPELKVLLQHCHHVDSLEREFHELHHDDLDEVLAGMQGQSPRMKQVFAAIRKVANTEAPVLILGESGTGKELAARTIHQLSPRKGGPFVAINCGAIPHTLTERELFGQEPNPMTDAQSLRRGRVELATGGTLFLDEVGELPTSLQVRLLRFLQHGVIERVGGTDAVQVDARLLAATHGELASQIQTGRFRDDLYYRLAVVVIRLPPLRERKQDITLLAETFLGQFVRQYGKQPLRFDAAAMRALERHPWPGNVRELENCLRRAVIMVDRGVLGEEDLDLPPVAAPASMIGLRKARQETERELIVQALHRHHGKIAPAAVELGITRPTFYALMHKLGVTRASEPTASPPGAD